MGVSVRGSVVVTGVSRPAGRRRAAPRRLRRAPRAAAAGADPEPAGAKEAVLAALDAGGDAAVRAALTAALPALEAANPTPEPSRSDALAGTWAVRHAGAAAGPRGPVDSPTREVAMLMYAAGFGPGAAALSLASRLPDNVVRVKEAVSLEVSPGESKATLSLGLLDGQANVDAVLTCQLVPDGPAKLIETGKEVSVNGGAPVTIPPQVRYTRDLFITYLDDTLLVARDATGSPDVLVRDAPAPAEPEPPAAAQEPAPAAAATPVVEPDAVVPPAASSPGGDAQLDALEIPLDDD